MNYIPLSLLALWRAARPSTDRSVLPAFKAPAAFLDEIREDQLSRASSYESEVDDECEGTSFDLPEGWDNDATDAAFAKGAALLRGEVGIDELTEVKVLREPPLVCVERARPATPVSSGLLGALGAATAVFQSRLALASSAVVIVGGAIVLTHHRPATNQHPDIAKAEPEQQRPAPEQAIPAPRAQGAQVAMAQPNIPPSPPAVHESASVQGPKAAAAPTLQRESISSPAPGPASVAVAVLPLQRQDVVARKAATSPNVVSVPPSQVPESEPVIAMKDSPPAGALPVTPVPRDLVGRTRSVLFEIVVARAAQGASNPASQAGSGADRLIAAMALQGAACGASNAACLADSRVRATQASEQFEQTMAASAAELAAANAALAACDASDAACLDAALPRAIKAGEQFEQNLTSARAELDAARAALIRTDARALASERARLAIEQRELAAARERAREQSSARALVSDRTVLKTQTNAATASQERRIVEGAAEVAGGTALVLGSDVRSGCSASPAGMGALSCERKATTKVGVGPR